MACRKIRKRILAMSFAASTLGLEAKPSHSFECLRFELGAIGGKQNPGAGVRKLQGGGEEILEMLLHLPAASLVAAGKGGRIEDDHVELLSTPRQSRKNVEDVIGEKTMPCGGLDVIQGEVPASAVEGLLGKIDTNRAGASESGYDAERAGIGEGVQQSPRLDAPDKSAVGPLVEE